MFGIRRSYGAEYMETPCCTTLILLQNLIENRQRPPASIMKFSEMISNQSTTGLRRKDVCVMRDAQANADTVVLIRVESIAGHKEIGSDACFRDEWSDIFFARRDLNCRFPAAPFVIVDLN